MFYFVPTIKFSSKNNWTLAPQTSATTAATTATPHKCQTSIRFLVFNLCLLLAVNVNITLVWTLLLGGQWAGQESPSGWMCTNCSTYFSELP